MEYQKVINLLDNKPNPSSKFKTKNLFKINDDSRETYSSNNQVKFKSLMLYSSLCKRNDVHILVEEAKTVSNMTVTNNGNKTVVFKNCASFIDSVSEINNMQEENAKDI